MIDALGAHFARAEIAEMIVISGGYTKLERCHDVSRFLCLPNRHLLHKAYLIFGETAKPRAEILPS